MSWLLAVAGLVLVVGAARIGGALAARVGQPQIAGQLVGVVFVGPTVLGGQVEGVVEGAAAAGLTGDLFPATSVDVLTVVGSLGLVLYMLLVGLTIDPRAMARRAGTIALLAVAVSVVSAGIAIVAAGPLRDDGGWAGPGTGAAAFAIALGAALVVNGVPVVARIFEERDLLRTSVGAIVIAAGAAATTLALVASGAAIKGGDGAAAARFAAILAAAAVAFAVLVPLARTFGARLAPAVAVAALLGIAIAAGAAGRTLLGTALLGPLVVGIATDERGAAAVFAERHLGDAVRGVLLPVFLGVAVLHADLRELGAEAIAPVAAILVAVIAAKLVAGYAVARVTGFDRADAGTVASMLQCGGIMTIAISLAVLDAGLVTTRTHALLTLLGLVSTVIAGPLLRRSRALG